MQTKESLKTIIDQISYKDWTFRLGFYKDDTPYVQVLFTDRDRITGIEEVQRCRKWVLSYHMVNSEVVRTAYKAAVGAMEHEVSEEFKYKSARVYNPHLDLDTLADAINQHTVKISLRDESGYEPTVKP